LHLSPPNERHTSLATPEQKVTAAISPSPGITGARTTSAYILSGFWNKKKPKMLALLADVHFPVFDF
jgi:hypothetical protein